MMPAGENPSPTYQFEEQADWFPVLCHLPLTLPPLHIPHVLEHELQRKLHLPRSVRLKDMVECRRTDVAVG